MLKRLLLAGLLVVSVVLMWGAEVHAGCIPLGNGDQICDDWITGSEICLVTVITKGTTSEGKSTNLDCSEDDCEVTCTVSGTVESGKSTKTAESWQGKPCMPGDSNCGILGFAFCEQSTNGGSFNTSGVASGDNDDDKGGSRVVRQQLILTPKNTHLPLQAEGQIPSKHCQPKKNGGAICQTSLEVDPEECENCCKKGDFITFTAQVFFAQVRICPSEKQHKNCVTITERCSIDSDSIRFGKSKPYSCELIELEDGMK